MERTKAALREVAELRERQQFRAAMDLLRTLDDGRTDVAYHMAWVIDAEGRDDEAIRWYQRALKRNAAGEAGAGLSSEEHLGALLGLATVLVRAGRLDHAADVLSAAASRFPRSGQVSALQLVVQGRRASSGQSDDSGR